MRVPRAADLVGAVIRGRSYHAVVVQHPYHVAVSQAVIGNLSAHFGRVRTFSTVRPTKCWPVLTSTNGRFCTGSRYRPSTRCIERAVEFGVEAPPVVVTNHNYYPTKL